MKFDVKKIDTFFVIFLLSVITICFAFYIELALKFIPCSLCKIERLILYLYITVFVLFKKCKYFSVFAFVNFASGLCVCLYHIMLEKGIIVDSCKFNISMLNSNVSCAVVSFEIMGVSLTQFVFLFYFCILFFLFVEYKRNVKNVKS